MTTQSYTIDAPLWPSKLQPQSTAEMQDMPVPESTGSVLRSCTYCGTEPERNPKPRRQMWQARHHTQTWHADK